MTSEGFLKGAMATPANELYEFGRFRLDAGERVLWLDGKPLTLPPKAIDTLILLIRQNGHILEKEELMNQVWPGTFVEENNLTQYISLLRKTLGDDGNGQRFIETVPRRGYRFVADVCEISRTNGRPEESAELPRPGTLQTRIIEEQAEIEASAPSQEKNADVRSIGKSLRLRRWRWPALAAVAVLLAAALVFYFRMHRAVPLSERDYILLADFENSTGEPVFDGTLRQALAIKLEESPFLNIFPEQRVRETLGLMGKSADERLTPPIAQEVCQRQSIKAEVAGSIARIGTHYVIAVNATNCLTGASLGREQIDVAEREQVLPALGKASSALREKLGESLASIQKLDTPIERATTSSLEAFQAVTMGKALQARGAQAEAVPFFEHAIDLDPNFTLPYDGLAVAYTTMGEKDKAIQYKKKEFELREHATQRQRFGINITYYYMATGELDKADAEYEVYEQLYPREFAPYVNQSALNIDSGRFDRALAKALEALRRSPDNNSAYANAGWAAFRSGQIDQAKILFEQAVARKVAGSVIHRGLFTVAYFQTDIAAMQREAELSKGKEEYRLLFLEAEMTASAGKLKEAREIFTRSAELAHQNHLDEVVAAETAGRALMEASFGNDAEAHHQAVEALEGYHGKDTLSVAASALALAGDTKRAEACLRELAERYPLDTLVNAVAAPATRAAVEIHRGQPAQAVDALRAATPYELGPFTSGQGFLPGYLRGQAYLRLGRVDEAAGEFQKIIDHRTAAPFAPLEALAHLGLARAYALNHDREKSRQAYQEFFSLWKDADPDIPVLRQAKIEFAHLS